MELHQVHDFVAVAEELSFTRAAARLDVSQPSLTRKVRNLEAEIGVELVDRSKGHLELTQAGRGFLGDAKRLLALAAESIEEARRVSRNESRQFRIGYTAGFDYHRLSATLAAFHRVCPDAKLGLFDMLRRANPGFGTWPDRFWVHWDARRTYGHRTSRRSCRELRNARSVA